MGDLNLGLNKLELEYREKANLYDKLRTELLKQIQELLLQSGIVTAVQIESRLKKWDSIRDKCERYKMMPGDLSAIKDLVGIRIVLLFKQDLDKVCEITEKYFEIIEKEDTFKRLADNQFGYGSIHYILRPPQDWLTLPTLKGLNGLIAEVQVRTASQHIWAAASHNMQYKQVDDVPVPLRRTINRIAALLEIVDFELERVLLERKSYIQSIGSEQKDEPLNTDSLRNLLDSLYPKENQGDVEDYADLLKDLRHLNILTVKQLEKIIRNQFLKVMEEDKEKVEGRRKRYEQKEIFDKIDEERILRGVFFLHVGLARMSLRKEFGKKYDDYLFEKRKGGEVKK